MASCLKANLRHGFTLMELAVGLVIVGLTIGMIAKTEKATQPNDCYVQTQGQLTNINTALQNYMSRNNRLPVPAGLGYGVADPAFGREATVPQIGSVGGILYGALPFQALGLPSTLAADCWGNKFSYVVTGSLTAAGSGPPTKAVGFLDPDTSGTITVESTATTTIMGNAAYAVISHGANGTGNGAYAKNYKSTNDPGPCAGTALESLNCTRTGVLASAAFNNGKNAGNNYFDDVIIYSAKPSSICPAQTVSWSVGAISCSAPAPATAAGDTVNLVDNTPDVAPNGSGAASFTCQNGAFSPSLSPPPGTPNCTSSGSGTPVCGSATGSVYNSGDPAPTGTALCSTGTGSTPTYASGEYNWQCTDGGNSINCNSTPASGCAAGTLTWGAGCSASFTSTASGGTESQSNTAGGYSGSATYSCSGTSWAIQTSSCTPTGTCPTTTLNWGAGCTGSFASVASGSSQSATNTATAYTGSATATCSAGSWSSASGSCTPAAAPCSTATLVWGASCQGSFPGTTDGNSSTASNTQAGSTGSASTTCHNGTWDAPSGSCATAATSCTSSNPIYFGDGCVGFIDVTGNEGDQRQIFGGSNCGIDECGSATIQCESSNWLVTQSDCALGNSNYCSGDVYWGDGCQGAAGYGNAWDNATVTATIGSGQVNVQCDGNTGQWIIDSYASATCTAATCDGAAFPCPGRACDPVYGTYSPGSSASVTCYNSAYDTPVGSASGVCQGDGSWAITANNSCN